MFRIFELILLLITINNYTLHAKGLVFNHNFSHSIEYNTNLFYSIKSDQKEFYINPNSSEVILIENGVKKAYGWNVDHYGLQHSSYAIFDTVLFSFGGYGFWKENNVLRYFNKYQGWIPFVLENNSVISPSHSSILLVDSNQLYIFAGKSTDPNNPLITNHLKELSIVDIKNRRARTIPLEFSINQDNFIGIYNDTIMFISNDNYFLYNVNKNAYYKLFKNENFYKFYSNKKFEFKYGKLVSENNSLNLDYLFDSKRYYSNLNKGYLILLITLIILTLLIISYKKNIGKAKEPRKLNEIELTEIEKRVISQLLDVDFVTGQEFLVILDDGFSSTSNLFKRRREIVLSINAKMNYEVLIIGKDKLDARVRTFRISPNISKEVRNRMRVELES